MIMRRHLFCKVSRILLFFCDICYGYASTIIICLYNNLCAILLSMSLL